MKTGFLFFIIFLFVSCSGNKKKVSDLDRSVDKVLLVPTTKVEVRNITNYDSYPSTVEGIINSEVRTKITGYITEVLVDEGQKVSKGQRLFKLETQSRDEDALAAKANIQAAQVKVDQLLPLVEQNIVSQSQLEAAKAQLAQAKAVYKSIEAEISYSNITSPISGYVGEVRIRQGNLVSPTDPAPLTTISETDQVYVYFTMNEKEYLNFIKGIPGNNIKDKIQYLPKISFTMANGDIYPYKGVIQTINSQVDKNSGAISFRAMFANPDHVLTNGSTGSVQIPKEHNGIVVVPQQSTYESQNKILVMEILQSDQGAIAHAKTIEVMDKTQGLYLVKSGIEAGAEIVIKGVNKIPDGALVQTKTMPFDSAIQAFAPVFEK